MSVARNLFSFEISSVAPLIQPLMEVEMGKSEKRTWLSLPQGAARARRSRAKLLVLSVEGLVEVRAFGGRVFISAESVDALLAREIDGPASAPKSVAVSA
jgi:hypothetical protein